MILGNFFEKLLARDIRRSKQGGGISQGAYFTKFWTRRWSGKTFTADQWQLSNNLIKEMITCSASLLCIEPHQVKCWKLPKYEIVGIFEWFLYLICLEVIQKFCHNIIFKKVHIWLEFSHNLFCIWWVHYYMICDFFPLFLV